MNTHTGPARGDPEDMTPVGGCNGILLVPCAGLADYYRAHGYAAIGAGLLLALAVLSGVPL